ncbi:exodeoxyribonuclease VII small subunit [candidate division KSB1 bacterium]|nr:exodeoxyribonuclease VII small subunit [candidate division KSB1 bacterium]RQW01407.1 MAG: exodeoxyribonuclease VII small subunit [candidate division KSB1 bacterium]
MKTKDLTFEAAFARLEEIADLLENGEADLERTMALFEEASRLTTFCSEKLDAAEKKLQILIRDDGFKLMDEEN